MSSIIDDLIFQPRNKDKMNQFQLRRSFEQESYKSFVRKINLTDGCVLLGCDEQGFQMTNNLKMHDRNYCVRMRLSLKNRNFRVEVRLIQGSSFWKLASRQSEILFLKEIAKWQFSQGRESVCYVKGGVLVLVQEMHLVISSKMTQSRLAEFFNVVLLRNMGQLGKFVGYHWDQDGNFTLLENQNILKLEQQLVASQLLATTSTALDIGDDISQYKEAERAQKNKYREIVTLKENIVPNQFLEDITSKYFQLVPFTSQWIKTNIQNSSNIWQKKMVSLLASSKFVGEKKIDDYIFNTVKVAFKETMSKPFSEGGSCNLFISKASLNFISSVDSTSYFNNEDKKDRILAIKKLKPEIGKRYLHKLEHEKTIVTKLKGGCSYFIPKYYRMETALDPPDSLLMEFLQGQELDFFIMTKNETISLWTKCCLLLNVLHGMRYLTSYGIVHLDLKPGNVVVTKQLIIKIVDYGEAYHRDVCSKDYAPGHTFPYVAPEVLERIETHPQKREAFQFSQKNDVFAFGMMIAELIFNIRTYNFSLNKFKEIYLEKSVLDRMFLSSQKLEAYGDPRVMAHLIKIMISCLDMDPNKRPKFDWIAVAFRLILNICFQG